MGSAPVTKPHPPRPAGEVVGNIAWNGSLWTPPLNSQGEPSDPAAVDAQLKIAAIIIIPPTDPGGFQSIEQIGTGHVVSVTKKSVFVKGVGPETTFIARYQMFGLTLDKQLSVIVNPGTDFGPTAAAVPLNSSSFDITNSKVPVESDWAIQTM